MKQFSSGGRHGPEHAFENKAAANFYRACRPHRVGGVVQRAVDFVERVLRVARLLRQRVVVLLHPVLQVPRPV